MPTERPLVLQDQRFCRLESIQWWNREKMQKAKFMVVGAGALGNEILKNLALIGAKNVLVVDQDTVEASNLTRSILFRERDLGLPKVTCAAKMYREIYPGAELKTIHGNLQVAVGLGSFHSADVVLGAVDNREARIFINEVCARLNKPWIDGGIEALQGIARGFLTSAGACYECTMTKQDWQQVNQRRSCSLVARRAFAAGGTPTTPTMASIIASIQVQEAIKLLHGMEWLKNRAFFFDGFNHESYTSSYDRNPACEQHEPAPPIHQIPELTMEKPLRLVAEAAKSLLGGLDALDFSREIVAQLECPQCQDCQPVWAVADSIQAWQLICKVCEVETVPRYLHGLDGNDSLLEKSALALGLPQQDIVWARYGEKEVGMLLSTEA